MILITKSFHRIGVAATDPNLLIGDRGKMAWNIKEEFEFFKKTTEGYPIVMGRKTAESLGKPLKKRTNIVLSRTNTSLPPGFIRVRDLAGVDAIAWKHFDWSPHWPGKYKAVLFIGGAELFRYVYPYLDSIQISRVKKIYKGDIYLPPLPSYFEHKKTLHPSSSFDVDIYARKL